MIDERQIDKHVKSAHVNYVCHISVSNHSGRQMIDERQIDKMTVGAAPEGLPRRTEGPAQSMECHVRNAR